MRQVDGRMMVWRDTGFHAAAGDPAHLTVCPRGAWQARLLVETVLLMLTRVCHLKQGMPRGWEDVQARLAFTMAAWNGPVQWHGFPPYASGFVPLSMAAFRLENTNIVV
jgi:hypothetical protein